MIKTYFTLVVFLFLNTSCASAPKTQTNFDAVDTFGSQRLNNAVIQSKYGVKIEALGVIDESNVATYFPLKQEIERAIRQDFGFAYVELNAVTYFSPKSGRYLTIDVVEAQDAKDRMPFKKPPAGKYQDPDGVLALWEEYQNKGFSLLRSGKFHPPKDCPAWHCFVGFEDPQLAPYLERFNILARKNEIQLVKILNEDSRINSRSYAAFLLAHIKNGDDVVKYMLPAIFDSAETVRNNAMRVLTLISVNHPEIHIPVESLVGALHFPTTTDRNKAGSALEILSRKKENKSKILTGAGWVFFDMLKLEQPNNHDPAFGALKNISGENYGEHDYNAWKAWIQSKIGPRKVLGSANG